MKKDIERLLVFLIPAILIEKALTAYSNHLFGGFIRGDQESINTILEKYPGYSVGEFLTLVSTVNIFIGFLPVVVIAIWLWKLEKTSNGRPILWAIGAVILKYWILLLFIGQRLYEKDRQAT